MADEPTAALDSQSGRNVIELMCHLARQKGCTVLIVTHDPRILDAADRIIPILVACALDCDLQNSFNMGVMFFGKRASAAQIGITHLEDGMLQPERAMARPSG